MTAFPDIHIHVEDTVAEGHKLVTRWSAHATHKGDLMGIPPTGKEVAISGTAIDRFENGQSVEHWEIIDQLGLMQQLGVIPS
jgi:predicted ester cyclase